MGVNNMTFDIDFYREQVKNYQEEKEILLNALINVVKKDFPNYNLIERIVEKIYHTNTSIDYNSKMLNEHLELEKDKSEESAN